MELSIRGKDVLLTTHKTYKEADEANGLREVADYPPFKAYVAACEDKGPALHAIIIRNIFRIAHRVVGVIADVEYADGREGGMVSQSIHLTDSAPAVLLPVAVVGDQRYGVLHKQRRLPVALQPTSEAFYGSASESGFTSVHDEMLTQIGFDLSQAQQISSSTFTIGNEGRMAYKIFSVSAELSDEQLHNMTSLMPTDSLVTPVAVPLEVVRSLDDAKAALAASLLIAAQ